VKVLHLGHTWPWICCEGVTFGSHIRHGFAVKVLHLGPTWPWICCEGVTFGSHMAMDLL
jgi:hypothetical protein